MARGRHREVLPSNQEAGDAVMETGKAWAADIRRTRHIGDFREWKGHDNYKGALVRLLRDLKAGE
jgi:hypothetical protein